MFCPECGKPLLEKCALCPSCGSALPELPAPEEAPPAEESLQSSPVQASVSSGEVKADAAAPPSYTPPSPPPPVIPSAPAAGTAYSSGQAAPTGLSAPSAAASVPGGALPADVASIKLFFIISAVANLLGMGFWGLMSFVFVWVYFMGCLFMPLALITLAALVMDVMAIMKLNGPPGEGVYKSLKISCYLDCAAFCALVPTIMGILNLMNLGKPEVKNYFHVH